MDTDGKFFLGKVYDPASKNTSDQMLLYDPDDLTTHGIVVGMTGSGKTGLCIDLLEEAALNAVPSLMIDPKGDMTNTLLHFPQLLPVDFQPWIDPDKARKDDKTIEEAATETASLWKNGLEKWGIGSERIDALKSSAHFAVYTPGSDAGIPLNILASLKSPEISWENNQEIIREKISSTVTAILGLVGINDVDPVRSREHILLSNIFESLWSKGRDLELGELILLTQNPPFEKLGVFDVNSIFPEKDRFGLAVQLNNILAAPAFQTWIKGQPLDIPSLLYGPDGRPRHSIFYIAHLTDTERMFFVTLLYSAIESWMRSQSGSSTLRAIVYFDEIFGYLPPISNPPSKEIMLRMLKQARAFGVGQMLVTQNPVDLDYKALSNAGTWMIGKLQTDQDKERLLDGLEGAMSGTLDRKEYDRLISGLDKRVFLLHNVHEREPVLFQTRWAMNYLAGPLTRAQIPALNALVGLTGQDATAIEIDQSVAQVAKPQVVPSTGTTASSPDTVSAAVGIEKMGTSARPGVPSNVDEYFLPNSLTLSQAKKFVDFQVADDYQQQGLLYVPHLIGQVNIRYLNRKYNLDHEDTITIMAQNPDRRGRVTWDQYIVDQISPDHFDQEPVRSARFASLELPLTDSGLLSDMKKDFQDWVYQSSEVTVQTNELLDLFAGPDVSKAEFLKLCSDAARKQRDAEVKKLATVYEGKVDALKKKILREERELQDDKDEYSQRKMEEFGTHAENILSLFGGRRRRLSTSLSKRRMTQKAKLDMDESEESIESYRQDIVELEGDLAKEIEEVNDRWANVAKEITEMPVKPYKKDILLDFFGVVWVPFHIVSAENEIHQLPGYKSIDQ